MSNKDMMVPAPTKVPKRPVGKDITNIQNNIDLVIINLFKAIYFLTYSIIY